jgi:hypothetical protein
MPYSKKPTTSDKDYIELVDDSFASDHSQDDNEDDAELQLKFDRRDSESSEASVNLGLLESSTTTKELNNEAHDSSSRSLAWQVGYIPNICLFSEKSRLDIF